MTTPRKKIEGVLKAAIETHEIECVHTDDFLYAQPFGTLETLALFKPTFLPSKLNLMIFFGSELFKDGQPDFTKAFKAEDPHCDIKTGMWTVNYADSAGMKTIMGMVEKVMKEVRAPMGPFIPRSMNGWQRWNESRQAEGLKKAGFIIGNTAGANKDQTNCYSHCVFPKGWKKAFRAPNMFKEESDTIDVFDEKGCFRAEIRFGENYSSITFHCRYRLRNNHGMDSSNVSYTILDYGQPCGESFYTEIQEFKKDKNSFNDCESAGKNWLNGHHRFWEDPFESWQPAPILPY